MNFKVNKKEFLEALNLSNRAVSNTTPLPSLSGIKIICEDDSLTLISSDSNISIKSVIKNNEDKKVLEIKEKGKIVIDAKYILEIVRKIDSSNVNVEIIDGNLIKIFGGNSEFKITCMNADDYPEINFEFITQPFEIPTNIFIDLIEQTSFACSEKETRPVLTGVNFKTEDNKLYVNATDSYRLASKVIDINNNLNFNVTVPAKYLNEVAHSIGLEEKLSILIDQQKIAFLFNNSIIQTRLLDDEFPETKRLIPSSFIHELTVSSRELNNAIDRASFIKTDGKNIIKLSITKENVDITSTSNVGSSFENIPVISFDGDKFEVSCSGKYLIDAIRACKSQEITIKFSGELKPMIIVNKEDESLIQLISPVRTYR